MYTVHYVKVRVNSILGEHSQVDTSPFQFASTSSTCEASQLLVLQSFPRLKTGVNFGGARYSFLLTNLQIFKHKQSWILLCHNPFTNCLSIDSSLRPYVFRIHQSPNLLSSPESFHHSRHLSPCGLIFRFEMRHLELLKLSSSTTLRHEHLLSQSSQTNLKYK